MGKSDRLQRFLFEHHHVRGEWVRLQTSYQTILNTHDYPSTVGQLLGQSLAVSALLASTIKFEGGLTLQVEASSGVKLLVAKCTHDYHIRGVAQYDETVQELGEQCRLTDGKLMITIDQEQPLQRYQGIVACHGQTLTQAIETYFAQSEQLPTRLWLAADVHGVSGLLLQKMPNEVEGDDEAWHNIVALTETLTTTELLQEDCAPLLNKLYHEHEVRLFDPEVVSFRCQCSLARMQNALTTLTYEDAQALLKTHKVIDVTCEFCNVSYQFDAVDVERIFKSGPDVTSGADSSETH